MIGKPLSSCEDIKSRQLSLLGWVHCLFSTVIISQSLEAAGGQDLRSTEPGREQAGIATRDQPGDNFGWYMLLAGFWQRHLSVFVTLEKIS